LARLELKFLGDVEVVRDGQTQVLPPSKKTRALLAYLALRDRPSRRDHLCELLWELPDDPRGSLRWSLSKLRRLVDDEDRRRVLADRSQVSFDSEGVAIDVTSLRNLADQGLERASIEALEKAVARYEGNFLEGLELTHLYGFHAWCVAERELVVRAQARVLQVLIGRLADEPERALPHARALVVRSPYDEALRADLIRTLVRTGRADEAQQQCRLGERLLKEIGAASRGLLDEARREPASSGPPPGPAPPVRAPSPAVASATRRLVGRESEVRHLESSLKEVTERGRARVVLIQGEPGIGKSRLLEVAGELARGAGAYLLEASAFESETIRPFGLWIDALRGREPDAAREVFGDEERDNRDRLFDGLTELVARESSDRPVVLVFDLLENAAVQQVLRGLRSDRLLEGLRLGPLSDDAIGKLIAEHASETGPAVRSRDCRGNPLLAIELARSRQIADGGSAPWTSWFASDCPASTSTVQTCCAGRPCSLRESTSPRSSQ
jgi:DNA-binding SARP family transcriptional activator